MNFVVNGAAVSRSFFLAICCFCWFTSTAMAYPIYCQVSALTPLENSLKVSCTATQLPTTGKLELRFIDRFAGIDRLSERVIRVRMKDARGNFLLPEIYGDGVYRTSARVDGEIAFEYELRLERIRGISLDPGRYALVSHLGAQAGVLYTADLLPQLCVPDEGRCRPAVARVKLMIPPDWSVATTEAESHGSYQVDDVQKGVFILGKLRLHTVNVERARFQVVTAGDVNLSDVKAALTVSALAREQLAMMHELRRYNYLVSLLPFPTNITGLRSSALTRGRSVVMLLNPDADAEKTHVLFQRHLSHEMLHYYIPESLVVLENFDWFWEGFVRYLGLVTLNRLRLFTGRQILDEMENEYAAYRLNRMRTSTSLLAASPEKFTSPENYELIYRKGTLVAWLFDLELRRQTNGRQTAADMVRSFYENYGNTTHEVGNREVLAALRKAGSFEKFIQDFVEGTKEIDLPKVLKTYGMQVDNTSGRAKITVAPKLSQLQSAVLGSFPE